MSSALVIPSDASEEPGTISPRYATALWSWITVRACSESVEPRTVCMRTKNLPIVCGPWLKASRSASSTSWATCG